MESAAYEGGGAGGKLRRRPLRRATAPTPYDRPPTAARGGLGGVRNGWLSRLVDPASRIITGGASRLFSSVFRKSPPSLPAPPPPSDENLQLIDEDPQDVCLKSLSEVQEKEKRDDKELIGNSESDAISELEQLMKQKTFTRAEFNYLTELLRTRTIESMRTEPMDDNIVFLKTEKDKGTGHTIFNGNTTPSKGGLSIPKEEASPAEIAKAYMGSRPSKLPSLRHSTQSHTSREEATLPNGVPFAVKPPDLSVAARSIVPFPRVSEQPENGYFTSRSRGRSAIYRMSRSPYFKVQTAANVKGGMPAGESSTSSQWTTTTNLMHSGGKQALKRGSSVLDSDFGSFGPIRRIRQKSNLMSPLKDICKSLPENLLPSASTPLSKDAIPASTSSIQKHLRFIVPRHGSGHSLDTEHDDIRSSDDGVPPIPHQSGEMARKILQQLDKLVPSPKEKSSELKATTRDESPSKLTLDMLHGRALRSIEHIGSANFLNARSSNSVDATSDSDPQKLPQKQEIQGNGPSTSVISNAMTSRLDGKFCAVTIAADAESDKTVQDVALTESSTIPLHKKPAFKISAPEDSLDMEEDNDDFAIAAAPGSAANGNDKQDLKSDHISVISEAQTSEKLVASMPQSMHPTSTKLSGEFDGKSSDRPAAFSFPLTSVSSTIVQPPTPTMPAPKPEISALTKEETLAPAFNSGSKNAPTTIFSLNTSDPAGFKSDKNHVSESELSIRNTSPLTQAEGLNLDRDKTQKASEASKSFGSSVSSDLPTSPAASPFAFGAAVPSLNNGSSNPNPSAIFGSCIPNSGSQLSSNLFSSSSAPSSSSSMSSFSSAAAMFSAGAAFKFGSGTTASSSSSASTTLEMVKTPLFKFGSANTESSSTTGSSGSSTLLISSPLSSANIASAALTPSSAFSSTGTVGAPSLFTSTVSGSAAQAGSSLFSSSGSSSSILISSAVPSTTFESHSSLSSSFPFSSTGNGIFGFGASAQSSDSSLMLSSTSSQNPSNFGATASPIFGAQGTSSGNENSNLTQSTGQLSSFSSNPSFGMTGSPSFGFSSSPFAAAASSAKPFGSGSGFTFSASAGSSRAGSSSSFATSASGLFGLSSQSSAAPHSTAFGSSSPSAGITFGIPTPASGGSTSSFGSSTGSVFSFNAAGTTSTTAPTQPSFGASPVASFGSGFPQNDQMSVEDSMTDDAVQPTVSTVPAFGQPSSSPAPPSFMFGSPPVPSGGQPVFQFGGQNSVPPGANSFQPSGTLEFTSGGSFSLGSGGDKSTRKIVRVRRNKPGAKK